MHRHKAQTRPNVRKAKQFLKPRLDGSVIHDGHTGAVRLHFGTGRWRHKDSALNPRYSAQRVLSHLKHLFNPKLHLRSRLKGQCFAPYLIPYVIYECISPFGSHTITNNQFIVLTSTIYFRFSSMNIRWVRAFSRSTLSATNFRKLQTS